MRVHIPAPSGPPKSRRQGPKVDPMSRQHRQDMRRLDDVGTLSQAPVAINKGALGRSWKP